MNKDDKLETLLFENDELSTHCIFLIIIIVL